MPVLNQGGSYLNAKDVTTGDIVTFKDEGTWVESKYKYPDGNPKQDFVITVDYKGKDYSVRLGKYSRDELIPTYTNDTSRWVGKQAKITVEFYRSLDKHGIILSPFGVAQNDVQESETLNKTEEQTAWDE